MIQEIEKCSCEELKDQTVYLRKTPVSGLVEYLENGQLVLSKGKVKSLQFLGSLKTEFGSIGSIEPKSTTGKVKFIVSELVPALRKQPDINDNGLLANIEAIAEKESEITFNITVLLDNKEFIIKDGNKRTIAFYENRKSNNGQKINYPVFFIQRAELT